MLLFSISFIISLLFGNVETEKWAHSVSLADKNIAIFSEEMRKIFRFYFIKCWNVCVNYCERTTFGFECAVSTFVVTACGLHRSTPVVTFRKRSVFREAKLTDPVTKEAK